MNFPNWSIVEYFTKAFGFVLFALNSVTGDFWAWLFALFFSVAIAVWFIPFSIVWFVIKNNFKVGTQTWVLLILIPVILFVWMILA